MRRLEVSPSACSNAPSSNADSICCSRWPLLRRPAGGGARAGNLQVHMHIYSSTGNSVDHCCRLYMDWPTAGASPFLLCLCLGSRCLLADLAPWLGHCEAESGQFLISMKDWSMADLCLSYIHPPGSPVSAPACKMSLKVGGFGGDGCMISHNKASQAVSHAPHVQFTTTAKFLEEVFVPKAAAGGAAVESTVLKTAAGGE